MIPTFTSTVDQTAIDGSLFWMMMAEYTAVSRMIDAIQTLQRSQSFRNSRHQDVLESTYKSPRTKMQDRIQICCLGSCNARNTGIGKTKTIMSVAELKDALNSQNARKLIHLPPEAWLFQL